MHDRYRDLEEGYRRSPSWDDDDFVRRPDESRPGKKGIVSFVLALVLCPLVIGLFVVAGVAEAMSPGSMNDDSPAAALLGVVLLACLAGMVAGLVLGMRSMVEAESKKIFAIFGTLFNALLLLGTVGLIVVGLIIG
jgi:hypothetical protein